MADSSAFVQSRRTPLLRIPAHIRHRIYVYVGLVRWDGLPTLFDLDGSIKHPESEQPGFNGLLCSCRTIYTEASALLYGANRFVIHYRNKLSLQPVRNLTPSSISHLRSLKVVLNQASCHHRRILEGFGECCRTEDCGRFHPNGHHLPLDASSNSVHRTMLREWRETLAVLSANIRPKTFELAIVCDLDPRAAEELGRQITSALLLLPELRDCHLRLCQIPIPWIQSMAQDAVLQVCNRLPPKRTSGPPAVTLSLVTLPRELRLRIFEYTDLITPWKEVRWRRLRREHAYQYDSGICLFRDCRGLECPPPIHHGCQFCMCSYWVHVQVEDGYNIHAYSFGCFCRLKHSAFSSTCRCWTPPTPLFLICRTLYEDAKCVFFSGNRFVINDSLVSSSPWAAPRPGPYPVDRFAASHFLRDVVPVDCLRHIRFLELVFPPYSHESWPRDGHPALQDWSETLRWLKDKINAPGLTVRLIMAGTRAWPPGYREQVTQAQGDEVLAGYNRILEPLAILCGSGGLARFYAHFAWPWKWNAWVSERILADEEEAGLAWLESKDDELKERAERFIMGPRHAKFHEGSGEPEASVWQHRFDRYC